MTKRLFDVVFSAIGLLVLSPIFIFIAILIKLNSNGTVFFVQKRVGKNNIDFNIYKFRTMKTAPTSGRLTLGNNDSRITKIGYYLRRFKIDELPQLINILKGDMSFVGPRPELRYFVNFYNDEDLIIFKVKPGITGLATLNYLNEAELLKAAKNPETYYIETIIPDKLRYNKTYLKQKNFIFDLKLILKTLFKIVIK